MDNLPSIYISIVIIVGLGSVLLGIMACNQTQYTYAAVGNPCFSGDGELFCVIVAEISGTTRQVNGGYRATDNVYTYWLKTYDSKSGKLQNKKKILTSDKNSKIIVTTYGVFDNIIWLHTDQLVAYELQTLDEVVNEQTLKNKNSAYSDVFPIDPRYIEFYEDSGYISLFTYSRKSYYCNLRNLVIQTEEQSAFKPDKQVKKSIRSISEEASFGARCLKLGDKMYFLTNNMHTIKDMRPDDTDIRPTYRALELYTSDVSVNTINQHSYLTYQHIQKVSELSNISGMFLLDGVTHKPIAGSEQTALHILHMADAKNDAVLLLCALNTDNKKVWELNTGINTITNCVLKNNYCILIGNKKYLIGSDLGGDTMCFIDIERGTNLQIQISH